MAITQISRIQLRRGLQENLPQLASGELGWSIDQRRLFIGNGDITEGAPQLGNTEILTTFSSIFSFAGTYTYKGTADSTIPAVQTTQTATNPVARSMQDKFDDIVNFRDFGGVGNNSVDESIALNWAITQLYKSTIASNPQVRRVLLIPAGNYNIFDDVIRLLPGVTLRGEGKNSTFLHQTNSSKSCLLATADSKSQTGNNIGSGSALLPGYASVENLTLTNATDNDVVQIDSAVNVLFSSVAFQGGSYAPTNEGNFHSCINFGRGAAFQTARASSNITFFNCDFANSIYGIYADHDINDINVISGTITGCYRGVCLGEANVVGEQPSGIKISHTTFDKITAEGIYTSATGNSVTNVVSAFNVYKDVGNLLTATPTHSCISFGGDNSYSIGDMFDNISTPTLPVAMLNGTSSFATLPYGQIQLGQEIKVGGSKYEMFDDSGNQTAGIIGYGSSATTIEYTITRSTDVRHGTMKIILVGSSLAYDDDYIETNDIGIVLTPLLTGGLIELGYFINSTGHNAFLTVASKTLI